MSIVLDGTSGLTTNSGTLISASTIGVGGATPSTSGAGISFPATQSASTNANTLDDYEEGTWTPSFTSGSNISGSVTTYRTSRYIKIGNQVSVDLMASFSVSATALTYFIVTIPFAMSAVSPCPTGNVQTFQYAMGGLQINDTGSVIVGYPSLTTSTTGSHCSFAYIIY